MKKNNIMIATGVLISFFSTNLLADTYVYRHYQPGVFAGSPQSPDNNDDLDYGAPLPDDNNCQVIGQYQELKLIQGQEQVGMDTIRNGLMSEGVPVEGNEYFDFQTSDFPIAGIYIDGAYTEFMKIHERQLVLDSLNNQERYVGNYSGPAHDSESPFEMYIYNFVDCSNSAGGGESI